MDSTVGTSRPCVLTLCISADKLKFLRAFIIRTTRNNLPTRISRISLRLLFAPRLVVPGVSRSITSSIHDDETTKTSSLSCSHKISRQIYGNRESKANACKCLQIKRPIPVPFGRPQVGCHSFGHYAEADFHGEEDSIDHMHNEEPSVRSRCGIPDLGLCSTDRQRELKGLGALLGTLRIASKSRGSLKGAMLRSSEMWLEHLHRKQHLNRPRLHNTPTAHPGRPSWTTPPRRRRRLRSWSSQSALGFRDCRRPILTHITLL